MLPEKPGHCFLLSGIFKNICRRSPIACYHVTAEPASRPAALRELNAVSFEFKN
jgi:hypothetical protein